MTADANAGYLEFAHRIALAAGEAILPHFRVALDIEDKGSPVGYDPVTVADHAAETVIADAIAATYPDHGIRGEEHGWRKGASRYTWVIDPIDGTKSFILGQLHWGTLIALHDGERVVAGVAHQPYVGESFVATAGGRSEWRRGSERRALRTRKCAGIADAALASTHPNMFRTPAAVAAFARVSARARLTRYGGDCYAYCLLAMGFIDVVIEFHVVQRTLTLGEVAADLGDLALESHLPPHTVDPTTARDGGEPCARVVGHAVARPLFERRHEGVLGEILGEADVTHGAGEAGDEAG